MKFLLITHNDVDGVGQTVINLNSNLNALGHESKTILLYKKNKFDDSVILIKRSFFLRVFSFFFEFFKKNFNVMFSFGDSTITFNSIKNYIDEADVVIIYEMYKFISLKMLSKILSKDKLVYLRPLDMELATGGCHVNISYSSGEECNNHISGCHKCPQLNLLNVFNVSNKIFEEKKKIIEKYQPTMLLENNFTKFFYDNSPVTKKAKNAVVYLPINKKRTNFKNKQEARKIFKIKKDDKVILFGTFNLDAPHKGGRILEDILKRFILILNKKKEYNPHLNKIKLITFGRKNNLQIKIPDIEWIHLEEIYDDEKLNFLYRSADLFVSPATGCNGPATIREALVNEIPVVAFNYGEAEEAVYDGVNGYLVPCFDKEIFANSIFKALFLNKLINNDIVKETIKLRHEPSNEAKTIIKRAVEDLKIRI